MFLSNIESIDISSDGGYVVASDHSDNIFLIANTRENIIILITTFTGIAVIIITTGLVIVSKRRRKIKDGGAQK